MKPNDLKPPFSFRNRRPCLQDSVFFVPIHYSDYSSFSFPGFSALFEKEAPLAIEYCSGNGDWIVERALNEPHRNWVAVELRFDRIRKIWSKMKNRALSNLFLVCGEAYTFTHHYLSSQCVDEIFINFPDPWPKHRHEKHRLIKPKFLSELSRVLKRGGNVNFVTDDPPYLGETLALFHNTNDFSSHFPAPYYVTELSGYGSSWFDALWRDKGKQIHYTQFVKVGEEHVV